MESQCFRRELPIANCCCLRGVLPLGVYGVVIADLHRGIAGIVRCVWSGCGRRGEQKELGGCVNAEMVPIEPSSERCVQQGEEGRRPKGMRIAGIDVRLVWDRFGQRNGEWEN